jgi:deoxyribonuclease-4
MSRNSLGAHVSIAGGIYKAIQRGEEIGCDALQVFVKNASQWQAKPIAEETAARFRSAHNASSIGPIAAHASYLINLAGTDRTKLDMSCRALTDELERCTLLEIPCLVVHPGAHLGTGEQEGILQISKSLRRCLSSLPQSPVRVLLENTAGQGTVLGYRLEHLAAIIELSDDLSHRLGVCIDTCHAFAAGYAIHEEQGYEDFWGTLNETIGLKSVHCFHLNDSQKGYNSRRDRHANLGQGEIGIDLFRRLVSDPRVSDVPMILETPLGTDGEGHRRDLELLRSLP